MSADKEIVFKRVWSNTTALKDSEGRLIPADALDKLENAVMWHDDIDGGYSTPKYLIPYINAVRAQIEHQRLLIDALGCLILAANGQPQKKDCFKNIAERFKKISITQDGE